MPKMDLSRDAKLEFTYILTGYMGEDGTPKPGTLEPVASTFIVGKYSNDECFYFADHFGTLRNIGADLSAKAASVKKAGTQMHIHIVPPGLTRSAFFRNEKMWQKELLEAIKEVSFPEAIPTLPISFQQGDLYLEGEGSEELRNKFKPGRSYQGQLIPQMKFLSFFVPSEYLRQNYRIDQIELKRSNVRMEDVHRLRLDQEFKVEENHHNKKHYVCLSLVSFPNSIEEGLYTITLPSTVLNPIDYPPGSPTAKNGITLSFEVKFRIRTLLGDFDYHLVQPHSVEEAILGQYPEGFEHLKWLPGNEDTGKSNTKNSDVELDQEHWKKRVDWLNSKQKQVLGIANADLSKNLYNLGLESLRTASVAFKDHPTVNLVQNAKDVYDRIYSAKQNWQKWQNIIKKFEVIEAQGKNLKLISQSMQGHFIARAYRSTRWQRFAIDQLAAKPDANSQTQKLALQLVEKNLTPQQVRVLTGDGIPRQLSKVDELWSGKGAVLTKSFALLDTGVSVMQFYSKFEEFRSLSANKEVAERRLDEYLSEYSKKYGDSPNLEVIQNLQGVRKTIVALSQNLTKSELELLLKATEAMLGLAILIPVVGEFAALALLAKAGLKNAIDLVGSVSSLIDSFMFQSFFSAQSQYGKRSGSRFTEHCYHVSRALTIKGSGDYETSPILQFHLRAITIIGLLHLIERCGSRINEAGFERKVKQYRLEEYIELFILGRKGVQWIPMEFVELGRLWEFEMGNKKAEWNAKSLDTEINHQHLRPISFHRHFPIHFMHADTVSHLAKLLCRRYGLLNNANLIECRIYARKDQKAEWEALPDYLKKAEIYPNTPIKIAFKLCGFQDFKGVPVSISLHRGYTKGDVGPIYKSMAYCLGKANEMELEPSSDMNAEMIKGLKAKDGYVYGCELSPFYTFNGRIFHGIKPFGNLGLSANLRMDVRVEVKLGDARLRFTDENTIPVSMPLNPFASMLLTPGFLEHKTQAAAPKPLFIPMSNPALVLVLLKQGGRWRPYEAKTGDEALKDFDFSWEKPFEMLLILSSNFIAKGWEKDNPIRFAAQAQVQETTSWRDARGPAYPLEFVSLFQKKQTNSFTMKELRESLEELQIWKNDDGLMDAEITRQGDSFWFAASLSFGYQVEIEKGKKQAFEGFKPFGRDRKSSAEKWCYRFALVSDAFGLRVPKCLEMIMPGLPTSTTNGRKFLTDKKFVETDRIWSSLSIEQVDYK